MICIEIEKDARYIRKSSQAPQVDQMYMALGKTTLCFSVERDFRFSVLSIVRLTKPHFWSKIKRFLPKSPKITQFNKRRFWILEMQDFCYLQK